MILPDLEVGGAQRVMLMLAHEFKAKGFHVDILVPRLDGPLSAHVPDGVQVTNIGSTRWLPGRIGLAIQTTLRIAIWLRGRELDVILCTVTGINLSAIMARLLSGSTCRLVVREAVTLENVRSKLRLFAMRLLYRHADAVIALSTVMAKQLSLMLRVPEEKIRCIPNPVDTWFIREQAAVEVDHPWCHQKDTYLLVSVGRLIPQKDYVTLLHAFAIASKQRRLHLLIVGDGPLRASLGALLETLNIADKCQFVGFDSNPWRWMARANLFVMSSRWEGHPNALLEALALGLPVVAASYDDSADEMANRFHFTVVPRGDIEAMSEAILRRLDMPSSGLNRDRLPDPKSISQQYLTLFDDVANNMIKSDHG